jgi:hypothetical protein
MGYFSKEEIENIVIQFTTKEMEERKRIKPKVLEWLYSSFYQTNKKEKWYLWKAVLMIILLPCTATVHFFNIGCSIKENCSGTGITGKMAFISQNACGIILFVVLWLTKVKVTIILWLLYFYPFTTNAVFFMIVIFLLAIDETWEGIKQSLYYIRKKRSH